MHLVEKRSDASFIKILFTCNNGMSCPSEILAKISPRGKARMISIAAANQDAETDKDMTPRL